MMSLLGWILFGFIVGLIARAIRPGRDPLGFLGTTLLGIIGAVFAGWLGRAVGWYRQDQSAGFISATVGAIIVLSIYHAILGYRSRLSGKGSAEDKDRLDRAA